MSLFAVDLSPLVSLDGHLVPKGAARPIMVEAETADEAVDLLSQTLELWVEWLRIHKKLQEAKAAPPSPASDGCVYHDDGSKE
jgi:hypothetical protein